MDRTNQDISEVLRGPTKPHILLQIQLITQDKPQHTISWMHQSKSQLEFIKFCYLKLAFLLKPDRFVRIAPLVSYKTTTATTEF